ncbi:MAG: DUF1893 domain-containing protein [Oscillospiraceae bacterium]|nr:DUF1893 domain-containing protein [Oscillospiraceae bacterium]
MKNTRNSPEIQIRVLAGLFVALGVIIPQFTGHLAGEGGGRVFLPMHIPVILSGFICGPFYGGIVGILSPVMSCIVTGGAMPSVYPMLPIMCVELFTYGFVGGLWVRRFKQNVHTGLILAMLSGRIMYGAAYWTLLLHHTDGPFKALSVWNAITTGLPGIAIQLVIIPQIMLALKSAHYLDFIDSRGKTETCSSAKKAKSLISSGEATCVAIKGGKIIFQDSGKGISPLISLYEGNPDIYEGAYFLDKVIGKAAAMILTLGGVKKVYGERMSKSAVDYLNARGIETDFGEKVGIILNIAGTGICPMENAVLNIDSPEEGYAKLKETLDALRSGAVGIKSQTAII